MLSAFNVFLIAALFCVLMLLVLSSLLRSGIPGVREWTIANALACAAFILYAFGRELPPLIAYEVANGVYAAAAAAMLAGFRRFFARRMHRFALGFGVVLVVLAIALFHYWLDSFAMRTVTVSVFQMAVAAAITFTVMQSDQAARRSPYPYLFTEIMGLAIVAGHGVRAMIYVANTGEMTSLLQPSAWNIFFISAGTMSLPVLTLGAVMIVHDRMLAKAERAANRDFLTDAWSRRALFALAELEITRARRASRQLSLLVFDVDNFKAINDSLGHAAGDQVLVEVVARTQKTIRAIDFLGRIGGEEFAVLLPETGREGALIIAERLRRLLQENAAAGATPYTVSIGVAMLREAESFQDLMRRADAALYQAKSSGRNCVVCETAVDAITPG